MARGGMDAVEKLTNYEANTEDEIFMQRKSKQSDLWMPIHSSRPIQFLIFRQPLVDWRGMCRIDLLSTTTDDKQQTFTNRRYEQCYALRNVNLQEVERNLLQPLIMVRLILRK